jgi:uncharacterized membrane protein YcaP (DUF421 family)
LAIHKLNAPLRTEGCTGPKDVQFAVAENNGQVTVVQRRRLQPTPENGTAIDAAE